MKNKIIAIGLLICLATFTGCKDEFGKNAPLWAAESGEDCGSRKSDGQGAYFLEHDR